MKPGPSLPGWLLPALAIPASFVALACAAPPPSPDAVAVYDGGEVSLSEVEERLQRLEGLPAGGIEELVGRYREAAETMVVHRLLLAGGEESAKAEELGEPYARLHRQAVLDHYFRHHLQEWLRPIPEEEIAAHYREHRESFRRPAERYVWHIFRRHRDPAAPAETRAFLTDLRRRVLEGRSFRKLAQRHSDSETRLLEGRLGWIGRGELPPALEEVVFALPEGSVSEPIPVAGGAVLFQVTEVVEEKRFPLEDVRARIEWTLRQRRLEEEIGEEVGELEPPAGSTVLEPEALGRALAAGDPEAVVLEIEDFRLTAGELRELEGGLPPPFRGPPGTPLGERFAPLYQRQLRNQLLYLWIRESGYLEDPEVGPAIDRRVAQAARTMLAEERLRERMWRRVDAADEELRSFYDDNRHLYQSSLRLRARDLSVPADADASRRMVRLEEVREALAAGEIGWRQAADEVGGEIEDLGWLEFEELLGLEGKLRVYLLELDAPGYTVPFQLDNRLHLVWIAEREEPRILPYHEVEKRVRRDYFERFQQDLYRQVVSNLLAERDFRFREEVVRRALAPPAAARPTED